MRKSTVKWMGLFVFYLNFTATGCEELIKDSEIKSDIASKAKQDINFEGVKYSVADRIVTLSGNCATQLAKDRVASKVHDLAGVKNVVDHMVIAPVVIGSDQQLKEAVDSVLKQYAQAEADIKDSSVLLSGRIESKEHKKLLEALNKLQPKSITDQLQDKQK